MRTEHLSFGLEKRYPSIFLLQGWLGGILAGYITVVSICLWNATGDLLAAIFWMPFLMIPASILAVVKATLLWAVYRLFGIELHAAARVVMSTIGVGLLAVFTAIYFDFTEEPYFAAWVGTLLLAALPTALLVGSAVKPWELFTFGSIAVGNDRSGSKSVLATLGTLPLRFLSLGALALWILYFASSPDSEKWFLDSILVLLVVATYLVFSAYVTFRSPRKVILLVTGLAANIPIALIGYVAYGIYPEAYWLGKAPLILSIICCAFLVLWVICLVARLSVRTDEIVRVSLTSPPPAAVRKQDHECLGSRFLEWQERAA